MVPDDSKPAASGGGGDSVNSGGTISGTSTSTPVSGTGEKANPFVLNEVVVTAHGNKPAEKKASEPTGGGSGGGGTVSVGDMVSGFRTLQTINDQIGTGIAEGTYNFAKGTVTGIANAISHPINTVEGIAKMGYYTGIGQYTAEGFMYNAALGKAIGDKIDEFSNGDAHTKTAIGTAAVLTALSFFDGAGEAKAASEASELAKLSRSVSAATDGTKYSVAYEMNISEEIYAKGYSSHFKAANVSLSNAMGSDANFASSISDLGISIPRYWTGRILPKSPTNGFGITILMSELYS